MGEQEFTGVDIHHHPHYNCERTVSTISVLAVWELIIWLAPRAGTEDEPNPALWLAIGYPSGQDGAILPARDFSLGPRARSKIIFWCFIAYNKSFIDQDCSIKMAGYWPCSFYACLWTSTSSWSINTQKKNLANIQPSWPHALSISHICTGTIITWI